MGTKYTSQSVSGYNSSPPSDDGSTTEANKTKWSTIKAKLSDPLNTFIAAVNSALTTHFDRGPTAISTATTLDTTHYQKVIEASGTSEITLTDAATLTAGWFVDIINVGSGNLSILRATASDTIDEVSADITLFPLDGIRIAVNAAASGFMTSGRGAKFNKGADVASAAALAIPNNGNYFDVTGTTTITSIASVGIGTVIKLHFDGALTLTHNATTLILPGGANITTAAGDEAEFVEYAAGDWRCTSYTRASGKAVAATLQSGYSVQEVYAEKSAVATGTTVIPIDDTIPQITEGDEYLSATITPTSTSNLLQIIVHVFGTSTSSGDNPVALFQDATANALAAAVQRGGTGAMTGTAFTHWMTAGTTSATTFRVRAGPSTAGTYTFNGQAGARLFGGSVASSITIIEYQV